MEKEPEMNEINEVMDSLVEIQLSVDHLSALKVTDRQHLIWMNLATGGEYLNTMRPISQFHLSYNGTKVAFLSGDELIVTGDTLDLKFIPQFNYYLEQILISDSGKKLVTIEYNPEDKMHTIYWRDIENDLEVINSLPLELGEYNYSVANGDLDYIFVTNKNSLGRRTKSFLIDVNGIEIEKLSLENVESAEIFQDHALLSFEDKKISYKGLKVRGEETINSINDIYIFIEDVCYVLELQGLDNTNNEIYQVSKSTNFGLNSTSLDTTITLADNEIPVIVDEELIKYAL